MKKVVKNVIKLIMGFLIIFFLLYKIGFTDYLKILVTISIGWFLLSLILTVLDQFFAAFNFLILFRALNKKIKFLNLIRYVSLSWALGSVSPGKLGEFGLVWLFKNRENIDYGEGLVMAISDKILTLIVLLSLASIGFCIFFDIKLFLFFILIIFLLLIFSLIIMWKEKSRNFIKKYFLKSYSKYFTGFSVSLKYLLRKRKKYLFFNLILTYVKWGFFFLSAYFIFLAFNFTFPYYLIVIFFSLTTIISLIPISFSGLGIREGSGTYLLTLANVPEIIGANVYITITFESYLLAFVYYVMNHRLLEKQN